MRIVLTGGGSAGHLIPFAPIIEALRTGFVEQRAQLPIDFDTARLDLYFCGTIDAEGRSLLASYGVAASSIPAAKIRRYRSLKTVFDLLVKLPVGLILALLQVWRIMPEVVVSKGGYASFPVVAAAVFYRIPVVLHESDVVSGLTNRLLLRFCTVIAVSFDTTKESLATMQHKVFVTGLPVRREFSAVTPAEGRRRFGVDATTPILLVIGGSQGARQVNEILLQVLPSLLPEMFVIHSTGAPHFATVQTVITELLAGEPLRERYKVYPYLADTLVHAMVAADAVVSRAGATTLAELTRLRKPMLLIPLAGAANDHQRANAEAYERLGAARVLDGVNLTPALFLQNVRDLIGSEAVRASLTERLAGLDHPLAARDIAKLAFTVARGQRPTKV